MNEDFQRIVEETIMNELNEELNKIREEEFIEVNKFEIKKEKVFSDFDICPKCKGRGGEWESVYHNDVEFFECARCEKSGRYVENHLSKYFDRI